ncbi:MAG: sodium:solute symporter family protein [Acidaminobacter sp.]|uniref:sodium:solute symporter family protein n=1 Tax=Acidaminobacter sp. TaxID=1872102 RepID=UPI00138010DF|nr:sodium:solute symporter family protein [Acidaminobacter sp.]MZQ98937.1 sodium:solute symporter family protein [Acidaminobacter sp.]
MITIVATILFSLLLIGVGLYANKKNEQTNDGFFLGSRSIGTFATIMTLIFSIWSTLAFYGVVGEGYNNGVGSLGIAQGIFWGSSLLVIVGYRLWLLGKKYGYSTPGDFFGERYYSNFFRVVTSVGLIFFTMPYIGLQLSGLGSGLFGAANVPVMVGTVSIALVLLIFVSVGGMRSVAWTDAVQGVVFTVVVLITLFVLFIAMPDPLPVIAQKAAEARPGLNGLPGPNKLYSPVLTLHLAITIGSFVVWPHIFIRFFIAKTKETYKTLAFVYPIYEVVCMVPLLLIGILIIPYLFGGGLTPLEAQMSIHQAINTIKGGSYLGAGIFLAAFAAAMSTASSQLLACSNMFTSDLYTRFLNKKATDKNIVFTGRVAIVAFVIISTLFGIYWPDVFSTATRFATPGYAQLFPPLIAGLFWKRANREGAIAGTLGGFLILLLFSLVWPNPLKVTALIWSMIANVTLLVVVSLATKAPSKEIVEKFHDSITEELFGKKKASAGNAKVNEA